jgi:hypothetical protein
VTTLLGKAGIVEDPGLDGSQMLEGGQSALAHHIEYGSVAPRRLGDEMVEGLMHGLDMLRIEPGCHRLNALALTRQQQTGTVAAKRIAPISVTDDLTQCG